jgi:hypothetical protein
MKKLLVFVLAGVVVMGLASLPAMAGGAGVCVTARVDTPFHLPNGVLYPAGSLTLCDGGAYSPVDNFHRILVSGSTIGLFVSSRRVAELRSTGAPQILFNRESDGNLSLIGYVLPSLGESVAFRMKPSAVMQANAHPTGDGETAVPIPTTVAATSAR